MDLTWGDTKTIQFVTNVGLITSNGPHGDNIMSAEWTHHISYSPGLIAVCIGFGKATAENIEKTKVFGISITADDQNVIASISGTNSGKTVDKISALKELGFKFYNAKNIDVLMVEDAVLNIECRLMKQIELGDHIMFVGEILDVIHNADKKPLSYHGLKFHKIGEEIQKPNLTEIEKINKTIEKHKKINKQ